MLSLEDRIRRIEKVLFGKTLEEEEMENLSYEELFELALHEFVSGNKQALVEFQKKYGIRNGSKS